MTNENCPECGPQGGTGWVELAFDRVPCSLCGPESEATETIVESGKVQGPPISHHVHADVTVRVSGSEGSYSFSLPDGRVKQHTLDIARHCLNVGGELVDGLTEKTTEEIVADIERLIACKHVGGLRPPALLLPVAPSAVEQQFGIKRTEVKTQRSEDGTITVTGPGGELEVRV